MDILLTSTTLTNSDRLVKKIVRINSKLTTGFVRI